MKKTLRIHLLFILFGSLFAITVSAQTVHNLNSPGTQTIELRSASASVPKEFQKEAKASRIFAINPALQHAGSVKVGDFVSLQLFEGQTYTATVSNIAAKVNDNFTLTLKLPDYPMAFGYITTSTRGKSLFFVSIPELNQKFTSRGNVNSQTDYLIEIDNNVSTNLVNDEKEIPVNDDNNQENNRSLQLIQAPVSLRSDCARDPSLDDTDPATIDLLIVYTQAAETWANSFGGGIDNVITGAMQQTDAVVNYLGKGDAIVKVHVAKVDYTEVQGDRMNTDLDRLTGTSDGYMDDIHQLRKQHNADIVSLFEFHDADAICSDGERDGTGGLAWILSNDDKGRYENAFNVIRVQQASTTTTLIHEIGHNMGMRHEKEQYDLPLPTPLYPYAWGHYWTGNDSKVYGSVMSYTGTGTQYFSNPNIIHEGKPTGIADVADNARVFGNTKHVVAFYSDIIENIPDVPANIVVSNVTANGATISWDNNVTNVSSFDVCVYRSGNSGSFYVLPTTTPTLTFNYPSDLNPCTTYYFFVRAKNACDDQVRSETMTFTTTCLVTAAPVTGVTSPVAGATPSTAITNGTGFTAALSWDGSPTSFDYSTVYTATITLTAEAGYTFSGGFTNVSSIAGFTVNGNVPTTWVSNNGTALVFKVEFPATSAPAALTGTATIDNTAPRIGDTLTGSLSGDNNTGTLSYQWKVDGTPVGTNSSTYTVVVADLGKTITLEITSSVETGTLTSAGTAAVLKKTGPATPAAPTVTSSDHTSVTLLATAGYEYSRDGSTWQGNVFTGLSPNTAYSFYQRVAETSDTEASATSAATTKTTDPTPPGALTGTATIDNTAPRIGDTLTGSLSGDNNTGTLSYQWKVDGTPVGTNSSTYTVVVADLGKTITLEITSDVETGTLTSTATAAVVKKSVAAPTAPTSASITATSVTLNTTAGYAYSMDGADWTNTTGVFTGLLPNTQYSFFQRVAETTDTYASPASAALNATTDKATLSGSVAITGTTKFGEALTADVTALSSTPVVALGALSYQWMRGATNIGTNSSTYMPVAADIGQTITVTVTAANCNGSITSPATAAIDKADGPAAPATVTGSYTGDGTTFTYTVTAPTGTQYEYSSDNWTTSQTGNVFTGFTTASPATTFYVRVAETATANAGASGNTGSVTFVKLANPTAPLLDYTVTDDPADLVNPAGQKDKVITITTVAGAEYSFNGGTTWGPANSAGGFAYNATVNIAIRYLATATHNASPAATAAVSLANAEQPAPGAFTLTFALNADGVTFTATIPTVTDGEYSFDGVTWSATNTKTDCVANTSYTGYVRLAAKPGFNASPVTSDTQISPMLTVATPVISPASGSFTGSRTVTVTCATPGVAIYYTTDGSTPTSASTPYTVPFNIVATTTVRAIAIATGMNNSAVATATYTLSTVTPPVTGTSPKITGPASMTLKTGYAATSTDAYIITGSTPVTVTKTSGDEKITWNNTTRKLDIAAGLPAGKYTVILRASNSAGYSGLTFTLTVETPVFWIEVPVTFEGGKVSVNPLYISEAGETVTLTVIPDTGYVLESIYVYDLNHPNIIIPLTGSGNTYTFKMPSHHIRIIAVFRIGSTAVEDMQNGLKAYVQNSILYVSGLTVGEQWSVYNIHGMLVYQGVADSDNVEIGLPGRGVYVVTNGNGVIRINN